MSGNQTSMFGADEMERAASPTSHSPPTACAAHSMALSIFARSAGRAMSRNCTAHLPDSRPPKGQCLTGDEAAQLYCEIVQDVDWVLGLTT